MGCSFTFTSIYDSQTELSKNISSKAKRLKAEFKQLDQNTNSKTDKQVHCIPSFFLDNFNTVLTQAIGIFIDTRLKLRKCSFVGLINVDLL